LVRERISGHHFLTGSSDDRPSFAAFLLVSSLFMLALQDSLIKFTSSDVSIWHFQFVRSALNLVFLQLFLMLVWRVSLPRPKHLWAVSLRSLLLCGALFCFFSGLPFLTMAQIAAGLYVFPLFVAVLSRLLLNENVGPRRVIAILTGFAGTLLILKPGTDAFTPYALLPMGAAFFYALTILVTRRLCREESAITLGFGVSVAFLGISAIGLLVFTTDPFPEYSATWPYLLTGWQPVDHWVYGLIAGCAVLNLVANINLAKAYQCAEASWLASFDYSYLVFATVWGFIIWRDVPDAQMLLGMFMIAGAGIFIAWRERRDKLAAAADMPTG